MINKKNNIGIDDLVDEEYFEIDYQNLSDLITRMVKLISFNDDNEKKPIYHFSKDIYYLDIFDNKIKFNGYRFNIDEDNEIEDCVIYLSKIKYVIAENQVLKIYLDNIVYLVPNLPHLIKIEYILCDCLNKYNSNTMWGL